MCIVIASKQIYQSLSKLLLIALAKFLEDMLKVNCNAKKNFAHMKAYWS